MPRTGRVRSVSHSPRGAVSVSSMLERAIGTDWLPFQVTTSIQTSPEPTAASSHTRAWYSSFSSRRPTVVAPAGAERGSVARVWATLAWAPGCTLACSAGPPPGPGITAKGLPPTEDQGVQPARPWEKSALGSAYVASTRMPPCPSVARALATSANRPFPHFMTDPLRNDGGPRPPRSCLPHLPDAAQILRGAAQTRYGSRPARLDSAPMALSDHDRRVARVFTAVVLGRWDALRELRETAPDGEPDRDWREAVLQAHVFAGFPRVVEAYAVLAACGGLGEVEPDEVLAEDEQPARGRELFERIYRDHSDRIRDMLRGGHPDFAAWIEGHAYGRVLSRPGLSADRRELLAVAALAALGQEKQLASHARGSLRCGAEPDDVREVLLAVEDLIEPGRFERAERVLERFV